MLHFPSFRPRTAPVTPADSIAAAARLVGPMTLARTIGQKLVALYGGEKASQVADHIVACVQDARRESAIATCDYHAVVAHTQEQRDAAKAARKALALQPLASQAELLTILKGRKAQLEVIAEIAVVVLAFAPWVV